MENTFDLKTLMYLILFIILIIIVVAVFFNPITRLL